MVTIDITGKPITELTGFSEFCKCMRNDPEFNRKCEQCDALGGVKAASIGAPCIYLCHTGLADFAIPIIANGQHLGAIMAGQVRFHEKSSIDVPLETIRDIDDSWKRNEKYRELYEKTNVISYRKLRMAANTLYYIGEYIIGQQYLNALEKDMADKNIQMLKESSQRMELERNIKSMEFQALAYQINPHFMFNTLNAIGRLAMMEKAYETEEIIYSFSDIMRYILNKSGTQTVTLKEEVAHTKNYLSVQKTRLGDRLLFAINFKPEWDEVSCPFMFLQPIIENSIKYAVETREKGGKITVEANRDGNDLVITVADDGDGMSRETIEAALSPFDAKGLDEACIGLRNINSRLIYLNGEKYSLKIESPNIKNGGTKVMIRLPI